MAARPRVFVTRRLPGGGLERLARHVEAEVWPDPTPPPRAEMARRLAGPDGADGLLCLLTDRVDAVLLSQCPRLRVVSSCSVGVDHIDLAAARARGIAVGHTPGVLTETTADLAFALLLAAARRIPEAERWLRAGHWKTWEPDRLLGRDLYGATLGVVGLGPIGLAVARRARGFGMRVLGWSRRPKAEAAELGVEPVALGPLLAQADFVSLHVALTPETRHLIDAAALSRMRPDALLVNTSRGEVVDEAALVAHLRAGRLGGAALDVYEREPLPPTSPLLELPNVVLAPHIGSASVATRARMADLAVDNLLAGLRGEPLPHSVE